MITKMGLLLGTALFFYGCTGKIKKEESAFIVLKTPSIKYADMGFIRDTTHRVNIEMYAAGQPLVSIEINALNICMSTFKCMDKKHFNEKMLYKLYPETLLENIFRAKPIFNGEGLSKTVEGFTQNIKKKNSYDITYSVISGQRIFRDTINNILIKVREQ